MLIHRCQKYGFRPFPAKIPQDIFESLRAAMSKDDAALMDKCYRLDTNVFVPPAGAPHAGDGLNEWHYGAADGQPGPVYVLKSSKHIKDEGERMQAWYAELRRLGITWHEVRVQITRSEATS